jgi:transcription antitermination factor NusG
MPAALPDREIEKLRKREGPNGLVKLPKPRGIRRGDPMRVKAGSFAGKLALWDGQDGAARVRVLIEALGRRVRVSLPKGDVEPLTMDHAALQQVA